MKSDLTARYLGMKLKNPLIVSSCGLTDSVYKMKVLEKHGAAALVLKSLFEEQIVADKKQLVDQDEMYFWYPEAVDFISDFSRDHGVDQYLDLIRQAKAEISIPVIASINCITDQEWPVFAKKIEQAGADGLELNIFIPPGNEDVSSDTIENNYLNIIRAVKKETNLPIAVKLGHYFTNLPGMIKRIDALDVQAIVMFNRFYRPDVDIKNFKVISNNVFSAPEEITLSLRWIALMSGKVKSGLAASTGIHDAKGVIKQLLAGAEVAYLSSALYNQGAKFLETILKDMDDWMQMNNFMILDDFKGKISSEKIGSGAFERVQFMKKTVGSL
ncbi:MAG: dihydroorotate dehydrogenase-like protein [Candidatus Cyclobacteriaceae bacterium M3_2C_046]